MEITFAAMGFQYNLATHFFDRRGTLIENALRLLGEGSEVGTSSADEIQVTNLQRTLKVVISPVKTSLESQRFTSKDEFKNLVKQFTECMEELYSRNEFAFAGILFRAELPISEVKSLRDAFPVFDESFASNAQIMATRVTYLHDVYRIHLGLAIGENSLTVDFDSQKVREVSLQDAIPLVDQAFEWTIGFINQSRRES